MGVLACYPLIYMQLAPEFYFSPQSAGRDVTKAEAGLLKALSDTLVNHRKGGIGSIARDGWLIDGEFSRFTRVVTREDGSLVVTLSCPTVVRQNGRQAAFQLALPLVLDQVSDVIPTIPGFAAESTGVYQAVRFERAQPEWVQVAVWDSLLWSAKQFDGNTSAFTLSIAQLRMLAGISRSGSGDLSGVPGQYLRMLYFSAITITTVGYGDVVPVTLRARLWAAGEAVLGIALIGLFVNAVWAARGRAQGDDALERHR